MKADFISILDDVVEDLEGGMIRALERMGQQAEGYAVDLAPNDTGTLVNSITHTVDTAEKTAYLGTPNRYSLYVELGTGMYVDGGRKTPWVYKDEKTGEWRVTHGQKAQPYIKPALTDHIQTYMNILEDELKG